MSVAFWGYEKFDGPLSMALYTSCHRYVKYLQYYENFNYIITNNLKNNNFNTQNNCYKNYSFLKSELKKLYQDNKDNIKNIANIIIIKDILLIIYVK